MTEEEKRERERARWRAWRSANLEYDRARNREYRLKNLDEVRARDRERQRQRRAENPEHVRRVQREAQRKWFDKNPGKSAEYSRAARAKDPARAKANKLRWMQANPEKAEEVRRRAQLKYANSKKGLLKNARTNAKQRGLDCTITEADIIMPRDMLCPVLGIPLLARGTGRKAGTMSLDRIDNAKGYVPRNVRVISYRANHLKHNATDDELIALGKDAQYRKSLIQHFMVKLLMGDAADQGATANAD